MLLDSAEDKAQLAEASAARVTPTTRRAPKVIKLAADPKTRAQALELYRRDDGRSRWSRTSRRWRKLETCSERTSRMPASESARPTPASRSVILAIIGVARAARHRARRSCWRAASCGRCAMPWPWPRPSARAGSTIRSTPRGSDETGKLLGSLDVMQSALRARDEKDADYRGQIAAIGRAQAVIEFDMDGTVREANENFAARAWATRCDEIIGKHHSMFVESRLRGSSAEYRAFWDKLNRGEFDVGSYKRIGKGGREVWIQASYNPIPDVQRQAVQGRQVRHRHHRAEAAQRGFRRTARGHRQGAGGHRVRARRHDPHGQRQLRARDGLLARAKCAASTTACSSIRPIAAAPSTARSGPSSVAAKSDAGQLQAHRQGRPRGLDPGVLQPDSRRQWQARSRS